MNYLLFFVLFLSSFNVFAVKNVSRTIMVGPGKTFDGKGETFVWTGSGDCSQKEGMPAMFRLSSGATIKNLTMKNAPDGIHIYGSNVRIENIKNLDVCEEAVSILGGGGRVEIINSVFNKCADKALVLRNATDVLVQGNTFKDCVRPIRLKPGARDIKVIDNYFDDVKEAIKGEDSRGVFKDNKVKNTSAFIKVEDDSQWIDAGGNSYSSVKNKFVLRSGSKVTKGSFDKPQTQPLSNDAPITGLPDLDDAFYLYNRSSASWKSSLKDGGVIDIKKWGKISELDIAFKKNVKTGSIYFQYDNDPGKYENSYAYTSMWSKKPQKDVFTNGDHRLIARVYSEKKGQGQLLKSYTLNFSVVGAGITRPNPPTPEPPTTPTPPSGGFYPDLNEAFYVYDRKAKEWKSSIKNGSTVDARKVVSDFKYFDVIFKKNFKTGSIVFKIDNDNAKSENKYPYTAKWSVSDPRKIFTNGRHTINARVFSQVGGKGDLLKEYSLTFNVINNNASGGGGDDDDDSPAPPTTPPSGAFYPELNDAFYVYDRKAKEWKSSIRNGSTVDARKAVSDFKYFDVIFKKNFKTGSIVFKIDNDSAKNENKYPYTAKWSASDPRKIFTNGRHTINAKVFSQVGGKGDLLKEYNLTFNVINNNPSGGGDDDDDDSPAPPTNKTKEVRNTIVIRKSGTYDYKNVLHIWKGRNWGCGSEKENGPQILRVEADNVTVKNFRFVGDGKTHGSNGLGDPIHIATCGSGQGNTCSGNNVNVTLDNIDGHACEDMITVGTPGSRNITIKNSTLRANPNKKNWDKTIQINFGKDIHIINNTFIGGVRCIRFKPNTSGSVIGNTFKNCKQPVKMSSKDKDIRPMKNGPSKVKYSKNKWGVDKKKAVQCNSKRFSDPSGTLTCK